MPHIILVTGDVCPQPSASDALYRAALQERGATVGFERWQSGIDAFRGADLVVFRSSWDYHRDLAAYRGWLRGIEAAGIRVANALPLVRWNLEKTYLGDLAAAGVRMPAQRIVAAERDAVRRLLAAEGWSRAVAKPTVGASGHGVTLLTPETLDAEWEALAEAAAPHRLAVQAYVPEITRSGQVSYVFLDGVFSHAVRFVPRTGDFRINSRYRPALIEVIAPTPAAVAEAAGVVERLPGAPLYARIDMVSSPSGQLLLEAELHEPGLLFQYVPTGAARFADATLAWIARG